MRRNQFLLMGALALMCSAPAAWASATATQTYPADRTRAHVVTRDSAIPPRPEPPIQRTALAPFQQREGAAELIHRRIAPPSATVGHPPGTVSRALSEQPVRPYMAEIIVGHTQIFVDPQQDLTRPTGGIDLNHSLRRAQRLHAQRLSREAALPARVIRRPVYLPAPAAEEHQAIQPRAIIRIPMELRHERHELREEAEEPSEPTPREIPSVPTPPRGERGPSVVLMEWFDAMSEYLQ